MKDIIVLEKVVNIQSHAFKLLLINYISKIVLWIKQIV
jgi:hypothetical protein